MLFNKVDFWIQAVLGGLIILCLVIFPYAILLAVPFGAWQVMSAFINLFRMGKYSGVYKIKLVSYLVAVVAYFSLGYIEAFNNLPVLYFLAPAALGIFQLHISYERVFKPDYKRSENGFLANLEF